MKVVNFIKKFLLSLMVVFSISAFADGNDSIPPTPIDPSDGMIEIPLKKLKLQRSLTEPVEAYYFTSEHLVEVEFNGNIGIVTVSVTDSNGGIIYTMQHDTSVENGCDIFIPYISDCYYIDIVGDNYMATGYICI